jgi:hypothetical protein
MSAFTVFVPRVVIGSAQVNPTRRNTQPGLLDKCCMWQEGQLISYFSDDSILNP